MLIGWTPIIEGKAIKYTIKNFIKGLVDPDSQANLSDDYRQKCSELKNFYITQNDTLQIRPPLKREVDIGSDIYDYLVLDDGSYVVSRVLNPEDYDICGLPALQQLSYLLPKSGGGFTPIGKTFSTIIDDRGETIGTRNITDRGYTNRLAGGTFADIINIFGSNRTDSQPLVPTSLLVNTNSQADLSKRGLVKFTNVVNLIDIYSATGEYITGWMLGSQTVKQAQLDYTARDSIQSDVTRGGEAVPHIFKNLMNKHPYMLDLFPDAREASAYQPYHAADSSATPPVAENLTLEHRLWRGLKEKLGGGNRYVTREYDQPVSNPTQDLRDLYSNFISTDQPERLQPLDNDLILSFIIQDYRDDELDETKIHMSEYNPLDLGVFNKVINTDQHILRRMSIKQYTGSITSFCNSPELLLSKEPILLQPNRDGGVNFSHFGVPFTLNDKLLKTPVLSEGVMPRTTNVVNRAAQQFKQSRAKLHDVFDIPMKIVVCEPHTAGGYLATGANSFTNRARVRSGSLSLAARHLGLGPIDADDDDYSKSYNFDPYYGHADKRDQINNDKSSPCAAGTVNHFDNFEEFAKAYPELERLKDSFQPSITEIKPYDYGPNQGNINYYANRDSNGKFDTTLVPDFKIFHPNTDYQLPGNLLFRYRQDIPSIHRPDGTVPARNDVSVAVWNVTPGPATSFDQAQIFTQPEITSSQNVGSTGMPGVVIKCQIDNKRDIENNLSYSAAGNMTSQLSGDKCVVQRWLASAGQANVYTIFDEREGPAASPALAEWIKLSGLSYQSSRLVTAGGVSGSTLTSNIGDIRDREGPRYCPSTLLQIYFTYDYGSVEAQEYFKDKPVVSTIENRGRDLQQVTYVRKGNTKKKRYDYYTADIKEHLSVGRIVPAKDQAYETRGQIYIHAYGNFFHADAEDAANLRLLRGQLGTGFRSRSTHSGTATDAYGINYQTTASARKITFAFHDFIVPDVINMLGQSFEKLEDKNNSMVTTQQVEHPNFFHNSDRRVYDAAYMYLSLRFGWPFFGTSISDALYYRFNREGDAAGVGGDFDSVIPPFIGNFSESVYSYLPGLANVYSGAKGDQGINRPWRYKSGTAPYPERSRVQMNNTFRDPLFLDYHTTPLIDLHPKLMSIQANSLYTSQSVDTLRPDYKQMFTNIVGIYSSKYANITDLSGRVYDRSGIDPHLRSITEGGPDEFRFFTRDYKDDDIHSITKQLDEKVILGFDESIRELVGGSKAPTGDKIILETGATTNLIFDGGYLMFADANNIIQPRFSREAQNYLQNTINKETKQVESFDTVVSLFTRHRLFLFHKNGSNKIYCVSAGEDRSFKGISVFECPFPIPTIKKLSQDKISIVSHHGFHSLDFSSDKDTTYADQFDGGDHPYETAFTTLPIFVLTDTEYSVFYSTTIPRATVALSGFPEFTFQVLNRENKVIAERSLRKVGREVSSVPHFSGPFLIDRLPTSASESPKVRLTKTTDKYLSISSMVLDLGNIGRDKVGGR